MIRCLVFCALAVSAPAATTITLRPSNSTPNSGDAYNASANPTTNFGNSGALVVSGTGGTNSLGAFASLLKFDLSVVTSALDATYGAGSWTLDSLQIQLTAATPNNPSFNDNAAGQVSLQWLQTDSWTEAGITWNGLSSVVAGGSESLGTLAYNGSNSGTSTYALNSSPGFLADLTSGGIASFYLSAADPSVSMVINSRNFGTAANRPALIIVASPEPSRVLLLFCGLGSLWLRRKRG